MRVDFHMHSFYSDGEFYPNKLIELIKEKDLKIVALTDHDTLMGVKEYIDEANKYNIKVIPALELSTVSNGESIHVLGYFKSLESIRPEFIEYLNDMQSKRFNRMKQMVLNINKLYNFNIDFDVIAKAHPYMIERPHLADEIAKVTGESKKDIFEKYIGNDCPAYVPTTKLSFTEGVKMIRESGGIAILAHPYSYKMNDPIKLIEEGIDGVEVFYYPTSIKNYNKYKKYCKKHNIIMTGGSDYHRSYDDYKHASLGEREIEDVFVEKFLDRIENL